MSFDPHKVFGGLEKATKEYLDGAVVSEDPETHRLNASREEQICDFCCSRLPLRWSYPAGRVDLRGMHNPLMNVTDTPWGACDDCHELIEADDIDGLIDRAITSQLARASLEVSDMPAQVQREVRTHLREHFESFKAARRGPCLAEGEFDPVTGEALDDGGETE